MNYKDIAIVTGTSVTFWFVILNVGGLLSSAVMNMNFIAIRELTAAVIMLYPFRNIRNLDLFIENTIKWTNSSRNIIALSVITTSLLYLLFSIRASLEIMEYYTLVHFSIGSIFLQAEVIFSNLISKGVSQLIFTFGKLYLETMLLIIIFDQLNEYRKKVTSHE